ncbi:hypothetical protein F4604DRAFT_1941883 [Suillus subluteus]|nr:hypothetical protein F4604DRAFT_1941883 [Suillus subluteus]
MQAQPLVSVFLYFPQWSHLQQIIQLPTDEHPFVGFTDRFDFSGYVAHNHQSTQDAGVSLNQRFKIVGILAVPRDGNILFYEVFEKEIGGADFLRMVEAFYCRPNSLGRASDVWPFQILADNFIQFSDAPFPNGFPPPLAAIEAVSLSDPSSLADQDFSAHLSSVPPSGGRSWDSDSYDALNMSHDINYPGDISTSIRNEEQTVFSLPHISQSDSVSFDGLEYLSEYVPSGPPSVGPSWLGEINHPSFITSDHRAEESFGYPLTPTSVRTRESTILSEIVIEHLPVNSPIDPTMVVHKALVWKGVDTAIDKNHRMNIYRSLKKTNWGRPMLLTRSLFLGCFWVGLENPFECSDELKRKLITDSLLTAIDLDETTLQALIDQPLVVKTSTGSVSVEWDTLRQTLTGYLDNRASEMRKIVRACILNDTGFSSNVQHEQNARADHFLGLLCSANVNTVRQGIIEIIELQMFREILFASLFQSMIGLAKDDDGGRIADLFPEEVRDQRGLRQGVVGTLLTIIYHTFLCWRSTNSQGRKLNRAHAIIMAALTDMYDNQDLYPRFKDAVRALPFITIKNVFPMHPKELIPKACPQLGRAKYKTEVEGPIEQINDNSPGLPNSVFTSLRSQRAR